ncbi:MAG TPA: Crp/Fnr family transcriptional regulator [Candidatus Dormibacteraeota bacterium]|nr:Crp/Fnr family transcriptional regulator [Candidatus Dormibacteraeota bacterium]
MDVLAGHPLLRGVEGDRLEECCRRIPVRTVARGTVLNRPDMTPGRIYLVLRGTLRTYQLMADGRELLLDLIPSGGFDGVLSISGKPGHFTEAHVESVVAEIDRPTLERLIACDSKIAANLLELALGRLEKRERQLEAVALHDPDQQIARQLVALATTFGRRRGDRIVLESRITHQMLADMLGMRRETVTLHLNRLANLGVLRVVAARFEFDAGALERVARGYRDVRRSA